MEIGTHGMDHVPWRSLDDVQRQRELVEARHRLADAARVPVSRAALPLGRYDRRTLGHLRRLGYERVYTSDRLPSRETAWLQPRFSVRAEDTVDSLRSAISAAQSLGRQATTSGKVLLKRLR
jgi:peptidoglycan/xylan/chitin deacetylase (PgdA/CDA1 family)